MKVVTSSDEVFACYERSCAPPPVGKGGSGKGGRKGAFGRAAVANQVAGTRAKIKSDKEAAKTYGVDKGKEGPVARARGASPSTKAAVKKAIEDWGKSGKSGDQRDEKATAKIFTDKYGTRGTGKGKNVVKHTKTPSTVEEARKLTAQYGTRQRKLKGDGRSGGWNPADN